jgi:RHS repeat-associated protein
MLDQFGARYYSMFRGRFMGVDRVISAGAVADPQRWNRYSYALNNPLRFVDPGGLDSEELQQAPEKPSKCPSGSTCFYGGVDEKWRDPFRIQEPILLSEPPCSQQFASCGRPIDDSRPEKEEEYGVGSALADLVAVVPPGRLLKLAKGLVKGLTTAAARVSAAGKAATAGRTVLGHSPEWVDKAAELGARRLNVPQSVWDRWSDAERWSANQRFLDRTIARGDEITLATPYWQARAGSFFARELEYLAGKGYSPSKDGLRMLPRCC